MYNISYVCYVYNVYDKKFEGMNVPMNVQMNKWMNVNTNNTVRVNNTGKYDYKFDYMKARLFEWLNEFS